MLRNISYLLILLLTISLTACGQSKYYEGECIQNVGDGFVWRIVKMGFSKCTVQGWFGKKWGIPVTEACGVLDDSQYVKVRCPSSEEIL
jgi:hypothetical protein